MTERSTKELTALDALALSDPRQTIHVTLDAARELLGMEIAYFSEFAGKEQVIRSVQGDSESFGFSEDTAVPLEETYCMRMVSGVMPSVIRNAKQDEHVKDLPGTHAADMGSYVGVPLRLPDGRVYGTLCCASHAVRDTLDERDVRFMRVLARILGDQLGRELGDGTSAFAKGTELGLTATLSLWFAGAPNAAAAARHALAGLEEQLGPSCLHDLRLVVTELMTNAVRHAGIGPASSVGLDVKVRPDALRVEVTDPGPGFEPQKRDPDKDVDIPGGWGLYLVDQMTERWGVIADDLTRVWFEMRLHRA